MTLVEVLVATAVVMIAVLSVSGVYITSARKVNRGIMAAEAARLAEAVRAYASEEMMAADGTVTDGEITCSDVTASPTIGGPEMLPAALVHSPIKLVWKLEIKLLGTVVHGIRQHTAKITVAVDSDGDRAFTEGDDEVVAKHVFYLYDLEP